MRKMFKLFMVSMLILGLSLAAMGCGSDDAGTAPEEKTYVVGTNAAFPPFESQENGEFVGFDMDLIKAIAEEAGIKIEIRHMDFDGLTSAIASKNIDMAIAAMTITPDRLKEVDFTPYFVAKGQAVVVKKGQEVEKIDDLATKKIAVQIGTIGMLKAEEIEGIDPKNIKALQDVSDAMLDLQNGSVDAVIADVPVVELWAKNNPKSNLVILKDIQFEEEEYGIAVPKGDTELTSKIDQALEKVKNSGKYDVIYKKYFKATN